MVVAASEEPFGLRDRGLLESACSKPGQRWYYDQEDRVLVLATTLLFGIAQNHPFVQGNKRTAFEASYAFLRNNGWTLDIEADAALGDRIIDALGDETRQAELTQFLDAYLRPSN